MKDSSIVCISMEEDGETEDAVFCRYDPWSGIFLKQRDFFKKNVKKWHPKDYIDWFLNTDLPYITHQDTNPFELFDDTCDTMHTRVYLVKDTLLQRDVQISNYLGHKVQRERLEKVTDHHYLPGNPKLIYECYPLFMPDVEQSLEYDNEKFSNRYVKTFEKSICNLRSMVFPDLADLIMYQSPVKYDSYFSANINEFHDTFNHTIFEVIRHIYLLSPTFNPSTSLRKFLGEDQQSDPKAIPSLAFGSNLSLKPIGSVATAGFCFGLSDTRTSLIKQLWCHVEVVNLSLGIGEGYELYFNTKKSNFKNTKNRIIGADSTKIKNFLKYFSKCVSICLNSRTNKFIITDYYWCGVFQIDDIGNGEIQDAQKLTSKVKVFHYSIFNYEENTNGLTIRKTIASFFNTTPETYKKSFEKMSSINKRVVNEWELFKSSKFPIASKHLSQMEPQRKKFKPSPYVYRTSLMDDSLNFTKQKVNIEKSTLSFIAIGFMWSCQTLCINLNKFFQNKSYFQSLNYSGPPNVLLSVYDPQYLNVEDGYHKYYSKDSRLITQKFHKFNEFNFLGVLKGGFNDYPYKRWLSSVEAYNKLKPLQGDCLAKVVDTGYMEDNERNEHKLHFRTDGYYIIFQPISDDPDDLKPVEPTNLKHYELAKETINKIHESGVTMNPISKLSMQVLKVFNKKVYVINLEGATTSVSKHNIRKDLVDLDKIFNQKSNLSYLKTPNNNRDGAGLTLSNVRSSSNSLYAFDDLLSDSEDYGESDDDNAFYL